VEQIFKTKKENATITKATGNTKKIVSDSLTI
jgi:hypothetical protein